MISIVPADSRLSAIAERIAVRSWNETYREIVSQEQIDYMLANQTSEKMMEAIAKGERYYVVYFNGEEAGYFCIVNQGEKMFLSKIYVLKGMQRKGIASGILEFIKKECFSEKIDSIYLTVNRNNLNAISFYEKSGFAKAREQKKDIGRGFVMDDYVMEMRL
jgi:ribosomal protein S18 acetylase RimI-like enzyme